MTPSIAAASIVLALATSIGKPMEVSQSDETSDARIKLEFVVTTVRDGQDDLSSPFAIRVSANGEVAELRLGTEVPIPVTSFVEAAGGDEGHPGTPVTSFQYRNVGTNVTVRAWAQDQRFRLRVVFEQSTILGNQSIAGIDLPRFRTFNYNHQIELQDGESAELATATDPQTGETRRAKITLSVLP